MFVECKTKEVIAMACLGKKLGFHTEIWKFAKNKFEKKILFFSGQEVVQTISLS